MALFIDGPPHHFDQMSQRSKGPRRVFYKVLFFNFFAPAFHHQLPCVANDDTIRVEHWHNLEDKAVSEGTCHLGAPWLSSYEDQLNIERKQSLQHR